MLVSACALRFDGLGPFAWWIDGILLVLFATDLLRTPSAKSFELDRQLPERVGLSRDFRRVLSLRIPGAAGRRVEVHEEFPAPFQVRARTVRETTGLESDREAVTAEIGAGPPGGWGPGTEPTPGHAPGVPPRRDDPTGGPDVGVLDAEGRVELVRVYRSDLRGPFRFGEVRVFVRGPLGLAERVGRLSGSQAIAIEPALANLRRTLRLAASDRWQDLGVRLLRRRGGETEFESLREYVHGDDVRRVDWKAFARRGKPMVRQYEVERGQELILLVDGGRRMRITTAEGRRRGWTKLDWGIDAALELAAVALSKGDRVGIGAFERGLTTWVAPAKGAHQLGRLSQSIFGLQPSDHDSDLGRALRELAVHHRRRATVILISDVADPYSVGVQRRALAAASRRHRLVFAALDDPELRADASVGRPAPVRAAALDLLDERASALSALASSGARVLDALPADAAGPLLAAWLDERRR